MRGRCGVNQKRKMAVRHQFNKSTPHVVNVHKVIYEIHNIQKFLINNISTSLANVSNNTIELQEKIALCTLTNDSYLEYTMTMIKSFLVNNLWFNGDIVLMYDDNILRLSNSNKEKIQQIYKSIIFHKININDYEELLNEFLKHLRTPRWKCIVYKFEIFRLINYDKILFLDSDMVIINNLSTIFQTQYDFGGVKIQKDGGHHYNGGLFYLGSRKYINEKVWSSIMETAKMNPFNNTIDETVITQFFGNEHSFSENYNYKHQAFHYEVKIIHYIDAKPSQSKTLLKSIYSFYKNLPILLINACYHLPLFVVKFQNKCRLDNMFFWIIVGKYFSYKHNCKCVFIGNELSDKYINLFKNWNIDYLPQDNADFFTKCDILTFHKPELYFNFSFHKNKILNSGMNWFQNPLFWENNKEFVQNFFTFPQNLKEEIIAYIPNISNCISIHIRRTDFLNLEWSNHFHVLSVDELLQMMEYFGKNEQFICFTDDVEWAKSKLSNKGYNIIYSSDYNIKNISYPLEVFDIFAMSLCKHNIISNSTFSFWGAYLNFNKGRKVLYSSPWVYSNQINIIPLNDNWIDINQTNIIKK